MLGEDYCNKEELQVFLVIETHYDTDIDRLVETLKCREARCGYFTVKIK